MGEKNYLFSVLQIMTDLPLKKRQNIGVMKNIRKKEIPNPSHGRQEDIKSTNPQIANTSQHLWTYGMLGAA